MTRTANESLELSRCVCRQVGRASQSSFYPCFRLLPTDQRGAMEALYAFMHFTDAIADSPAPIEDRRNSLHAWRHAVETFLAAATTESPPNTMPGTAILPAVADAVSRFQIPIAHLLAVLDGVERDLAPFEMASFEQLADYCHHVATVVGLASVRVWGVHGTETDYRDAAEACGLAFQLTNILRDLREDARADRVYLPTDELAECGYATAEDFRRAVVGAKNDARFQRLMRQQTARVANYYCEAIPLYDRLSPEGRKIYGMMLSVYHRLFRRIAQRPTAVLATRVRLPRWEKLAILLRWTILPSTRPRLR